MFQRPAPLTRRQVAERGRIDDGAFVREVVGGDAPVLLRGQFERWPAVAAARRGDHAIAAYVARLSLARPVEVMVGAPEIGGRFFYSDDFEKMNFARRSAPLGPLMGELVRLAEVPDPPALYAGAAAIDGALAGWVEENPLDLSLPDAIARIWVGNAVQVATHYDLGANLAVVVAGHRRFTLFPPEQLSNLYVGPFERTIAGPPISLVDPEAPDLARFPRFADAIPHALVAELEPGDALFIPSLWWHHVRSFDPVNILVNYWPPTERVASPFPAFIHALRGIRDLPAREKRAWRAWFDHYVFADDAAEAGNHIPATARGFAGPASAQRSQDIEAFLRSAFAPDG